MAADPITAVGNAVSSVFDTLGSAINLIGFGKRQSRIDQPDWIEVGDVQRNDYTPYVVLGLGSLILIVIILVMARQK